MCERGQEFILALGRLAQGVNRFAQGVNRFALGREVHPNAGKADRFILFVEEHAPAQTYPADGAVALYEAIFLSVIYALKNVHAG